MLKIAGRIADVWLGRKGGNAAQTSAALAAVTHLKPIVVVTGGSRGIGAALAQKFAESGHRIALVARNPDTLAATVRNIEKTNNTLVLALAYDVTTADAALRIDADLAAAGCYVEVFVNCAGTGLSGAFGSHSVKEIDRLIALNIAALTRLTHHVLPSMLARRSGGILNVASLGAYAPGPYQAAYYASKSYVVSLTEAIATETAGQGVRISVLVPGPVDTAFHVNMGADTSLYRKFLPSLSADRVARAGYRGFMLGQRVIAPGILAPIALVALKLLPHRISVPLIAWLLTPQPK